MRITIKNARLAFPSLFEAKTVNGEGDPAFSASFILDPVANAAAIKEINAAIDKVAAEKWGPKGKAQVEALRKADKVCLHDGNLKSEYDGYEGNLYVSSRSKSRPTVVDRDGKTTLVVSDGRPYGGCFVNGIVDIYAQDNNYGKRINATLAGVQFVRDGDAFGGSRPASVDEFKSVEDEETIE